MTTQPTEPQPDPNAESLVAAVDRLTTQARRIADALTLTYDGTPDDSPTTPDDGPCAQHPGAPVIGGMCGACTQYPADMRPALASDEDQAQRWARREPLLVLLTRIQRGRPLTEDEATLLRQHIEAEMRDADTAREKTVDLAETYKAERRRGDALAEERNEAWAEREQLRDLLRSENQRANAAIDREHTAEQAAEEAQRERDQQAAVLAEVLRHFTPALVNGQYAFFQAQEPVSVEEFQRWRSVVQHDVERPWWQQLDTVRAELEQAQAALQRVRAAADELADGTEPGFRAALAVRAALDGAEQPTPAATEATEAVMVVDCSGRFLRRVHEPHDWEPQPGMPPVHCSGRRDKEPS